MDEDMFGSRPQTQVEEAWHNEQRRKQYDIIRIKNPTSEDFFVMYDVNQYQKVPANTTLDVPRYIATRFITHMKDKIINDMATKMHDEVMADRDKKGFPAFKDKAAENAETYLSANFPKTDDLVLSQKVIGDLWIGIVHEFGRDVPPTNPADPRGGEVDLKPQEMKILDSLEKRRVAPDEASQGAFKVTPTAPPAPSTPPQSITPEKSPFASLNEQLSEEEVTSAEG